MVDTTFSVARHVRDEFSDRPNLAELLERCYADLERMRWPEFDKAIGAVALSNETLVAVLRHLRARFDREGIVDATSLRVGELLVRFAMSGASELEAALAQVPFEPLREYLAVRYAELAMDVLLLQAQTRVNERRARLLVQHVARLAWLAAPPRPRVVMRQGHDIDNLIAELLGEDEEVTEHAAPQRTPTPVPLYLIQ